jgi:hypothetical protein
MNSECCGSQLYHTGVCCKDDIVNAELINQVLESPEEKALKDCACKGLGPCQCSTESKIDNDFDQRFKDMKYVVEACGCGSGCGC